MNKPLLVVRWILVLPFAIIAGILTHIVLGQIIQLCLQFTLREEISMNVIQYTIPFVIAALASAVFIGAGLFFAPAKHKYLAFALCLTLIVICALAFIYYLSGKSIYILITVLGQAVGAISVWRQVEDERQAK